MKASELRIGNWVDLVGSNSSFQIDTIYDNELSGIEPIPLTEEWLERFGFELPAHTWIGNKFHLTEYGEGSKHPNGGIWVVAMNKNNAIISEIKYVHQLQNLYHALTGEELTYEKP